MPQSVPERVTAEELLELPLFADESPEAVEWIASQMRNKRRTNHALAAMVATLVGAAALPLAQLPGVLDMGLL